MNLLPTFGFLVILFESSYAIHSDCYATPETVSWAAGHPVERRSLNLTQCPFAHIYFKITRPENSNQSIKAKLTTLDEDAEVTLTITPTEVARTEDGETLTLIRKNLEGLDDYVMTSPFTNLYMYVGKEKAGKAVVAFEFTLEDDGCPFPFLVAKKNKPAIITSDFLSNECDFAVATLEPGYSLELTSVMHGRQTSRHPVSITLYDAVVYGGELIHRIEQKDFDKDLNEMLGTQKIAVHISNPARYSSPDTTFITVSSKEDDCFCPNSTVLLERADSKFVFEMPLIHCHHLNCSTVVSLSEELRHTHRIEVEPRGQFYYENYGNFSVKDGISDGIPASYIWPSYISVHPSVTLQHYDGKKALNRSLSVSLVPSSEKEQTLCHCAEFTSNHDKWEILQTVDKTCSSFNCVWTVPYIEHQTAWIHFNTNAGIDDMSRVTLTMARGQKAAHYQLIDSQIMSLFSSNWNRSVLNHTIIHFRHSEKIDGESRQEDFGFRLTLKSTAQFSDYFTQCGCFNETKKMTANETVLYTSPRFPMHYCSSLHCRTTFEAPEGYKIIFKVEHLHTQEKRDFLMVLENFNGTEVPREKYTGTYLNGFTTDSLTNSLVAVFKSDESINYDGFNATVWIEKIQTYDEYFEDLSEKKSRWPMFFFVFLVMGAIGTVGVFKWRRRQTPLSLSFAPVSYWNLNNANNDDDYGSNMVHFG